MTKTPISLILDDPAPRVFVYYEHSDTKKTGDGRDLPRETTIGFLNRFCDVVTRHGMRGKFSIVPIPGGRGRIDRAVDGFPMEEIREWLDIANTRLSPLFSFCSELLTHAAAWDIVNDRPLPIREDDWASTQTVETMTPYIAYSLEILKNAGIRPTGVTSPWAFGIDNEEVYARSVGAAFDQVFGQKDSWYFLHSWPGNTDEILPQVMVREQGRRVVHIPATVGDGFWQAMDTTNVSPEYVSHLADKYLTADGKSGEILDVLEKGGYPVLCTHWQSMFSAGAETGLHALDEVGRRVEKFLSDRVEWTSFADIMQLTLAK